MSDMEPAFEHRLAQRRYQPPRAGLAERIILAARAHPQHPPGLIARLEALLAAALPVPQPAFSLATALALGLLIGFSAPAQPNAGNNPGNAGALPFDIYTDEGITP